MARNFCGTCGAALPPDVEICPDCGRIFGREAPPEVIVHDTPPAVDPIEAATPPNSTIPPQIPAPWERKAESSQSSPRYLAVQPPASCPPTDRTPYYMRRQSQPENCDKALSVGGCIAMLLLMFVPVIGIVALCFLAFGSAVDTNRRNLARACLVISGVLTLFVILRVLVLVMPALLYLLA